MAWNCVLCGFSAFYLFLLLSHINTNHNDDNYFAFCGISGCDRNFQKANSFSRHVREKHGAYLNSQREDVVLEKLRNGSGMWTADDTAGMPQIEVLDEHSSCPISDTEDDLDGISQGSSSSVSDSGSVPPNITLKPQEEETLMDITGKYLFKIKEENRLTQTSIQRVAQATSDLFSVACRRLKRRIDETLEDAGIDEVPGLDATFADFVHPFEDLKTTWMLTEFQKHSLPYVEPLKMVLGKTRVYRRVKNKIRCLQLEKVFFYVPILKTLELQFKSKAILKMVFSENGKEENRGFLQDFNDGHFVQSHPLFSTDDCALKLLIYYDDVNVANPMTNKIHQLGLFYYQLANIKSVYRAKLKSIHLFAICKKQYIKEFGLNEVLKPLVEDLKELGGEQGYPFTIAGGTIYLRGAILAVIADTPASQGVGYFKESVGGARRKCRHCMTSWEKMQEHFLEEEFILRDSDSHDQQVSLIEDAGSEYLRKFFSKNYGINGRAKISEAPYFDITKQLPQDIMHIFLEGILCYEMKFFFQYFFHNRRFTLHDLNQAINNFDYGYSELKDKPAPIKEVDLDFKSNSNLGQSASQMWLLASILPLLLDGNVDNDDPHWINFVSLLEIMCICFAHQVTYSSVINLKHLIKEHLMSFKTIYPNARILPKQHYLVHLPTQILLFGPLIRSWCMRFEGKHSYFKNMARTIKNFKNLPLSLAQRHQSMESATSLQIDGESIDSCPMVSDDITFGKGKVLHGHDLEYALNTITRFYELASDGCTAINVLQYNSITVCGTHYKTGANNFLLTGLDDMDLPQFGKISKIWFVPYNKPFFAVMAMNTDSFCEELNAFEISEPDMAGGYEVISHSDLFFYNIYHAHKKRDKQFITCKESFLSI